MEIWNRALATRNLKINENKSKILLTRKANEKVIIVVNGELLEQVATFKRSSHK